MAAFIVIKWEWRSNLEEFKCNKAFIDLTISVTIFYQLLETKPLQFEDITEKFENVNVPP